jgi:hypothetical protein
VPKLPRQSELVKWTTGRKDWFVKLWADLAIQGMPPASTVAHYSFPMWEKDLAKEGQPWLVTNVRKVVPPQLATSRWRKSYAEQAYQAAVEGVLKQVAAVWLGSQPPPMGITE